MLAKFIGGPINRPDKRGDYKDGVYSVRQHGSVSRCRSFRKVLRSGVKKLHKVAA
jgi:hypothetical protein